MTVLRSLLGGTADAPLDDPDAEPPSDEALRDAFAEAIEGTDPAKVLGVVAGDLVGLAHVDRSRFTDRLRALGGLAETVNPENPRDLDVIDAEEDAIKAAIRTLATRLDMLDAERETHAFDERLEPFDIPNDWQRDGSAFGRDYIDAVVRARDHISDRGQATADELYGIYRRTVPASAIRRQRFGVKFVPVLAAADGIDFRGFRLDPDEALPPEAVDEAVRERHYQFQYGAEAVAAAYRVLLDGPAHGYTRLGLAHAAKRRTNTHLPPAFIGPEDPDDLGDGQDINGFELFAGLLDLPGVEPPAEPAWRWTGGESSE